MPSRNPSCGRFRLLPPRTAWNTNLWITTEHTYRETLFLQTERRSYLIETIDNSCRSKRAAPNSFGKSTAVRVFAWCLGLEPIFGTKPNDPACLPLAVREDVDLGGPTLARVLASSGAISLAHDDGRSIRLTRAIKGEDVQSVVVEEINPDGTDRRSRLLARTGTMKDEHGGLQHFLFEWLGWPRAEVATFDGRFAYVYLENLAPLFYIEQDEGWSQLQARQVTRYSQQQVQQVAVEYLLGSTAAVAARVARQRAILRESALRETARTLAERVTSLWVRNGWSVQWSGNGSLSDIVTRWSARSLRDALLQAANVDLARERVSLSARAKRLREALTSDPIDSSNASAHAAASQRVIELKRRRHEISQELGTLRVQQGETRELLESLEHRLRAGADILRLKRTGIGRLEVIECPTCHRYIDPTSFALTDQSEASVAAHIEALQRDRQLIQSNLQALIERLTGLQAESSRVDTEFLAAERELVGVTAAVGTVREQLAKTAAELGAVERKLDRLIDISTELDELQGMIKEWVHEALQVQEAPVADSDLERRLDAFVASLRRYLLALGHSAVNDSNVEQVRLDDQYVPYLRDRRLQTLGSASDGPRVIAAYTLALADASGKVGGLHPGFVILDEPLQQNPDSPHRALFVDFLAEKLAREATFQTIVLTSLLPDELDRLREKGTRVETPAGAYLLQPPPSPPPPEPEVLPSDASPDKEELEATRMPIRK